MSKYIIFLVFITNLFVLGSNPDFDNKLDSLNVPGVAIIAIQDGSPVDVYVTGYANIKKKALINSNTNFRLASLTKQFTAAAILILVQEGKLKLNNPISSYFQNFPNYGKKVTIRHLLTHTSGIIDYEVLIPANTKKQLKDKDVLDLLSKIDSAYFAPGEQFRYSNSGYALLALIVEKVSGTNFSDFLKTKIFEPLKMTNTIAYEKGISEVKNRALGYAFNDPNYEVDDQSLTSGVLGDGGVYSNLEDLAKWDQSLYSYEIIKKELLDSAFTKAHLNSGKTINYGFGWEIDDTMGVKILKHTGTTVGFTNIIVRIPEKYFSLIILSNKDDTAVEQVAGEVIKQILSPIDEGEDETF